MANAFDRFDVQGGEPSAQPVGNPFDAFDEQPESQQPVTAEADEAPGLFSNSLRNAGERGFDLLGNFIQFIGNAAEKGEKAITDRLDGFNPGVVIDKSDTLKGKGYEPDLEIGSYGIDFTSRAKPEDTDTGLEAAGKAVEGVGLGYEPNFTIDKALDEPTLRNLAGAVAEQGPAALSDMAALIISTPAYLASRTQEIGEARVENDGGDIRNASPELQKAIVDNFANGTEIPEELQREADQLAENGGMPELKDYLVAGPTAAASVLLDRFALGKLLPGGGKAITSAKQVPGAVGRAFVTEAGTEAVQEGGIEYAGESIGTEAGYDPTTAGRRAAGGALVGGPTGGAVRGGTATYEAATAAPQQESATRDSVGEGARMDAEPAQEGIDVTPQETYGTNPFDQFDQPVEVNAQKSKPDPAAPVTESTQVASLRVTTEGAEIPSQFDTLFDEQGRARTPATKAVRDFKAENDIGQDGIRAIFGAISRGENLTLDEAKAIDKEEFEAREQRKAQELSPEARSESDQKAKETARAQQKERDDFVEGAGIIEPGTYRDTGTGTEFRVFDNGRIQTSDGSPYGTIGRGEADQDGVAFASQFQRGEVEKVTEAERQATNDDSTPLEAPEADAPIGQAETVPEQDTAEAERQEVIRRAREQMSQTLQAGDAQFDAPANLDPQSQPEVAAETLVATSLSERQQAAGDAPAGKGSVGRGALKPSSGKEFVEPRITHADDFRRAINANTGIKQGADLLDVVGMLESRVGKLNSAIQKGSSDSALADPEGAGNRRYTEALASHIGSRLNIPRELSDTPRIDAALLESARNSVATDAYLFGDLSTAQSLRAEGFDSLDVEAKAMVQRHVLRAIKDGEVFRTVIELVPIDVVNMLTGREFTTEEALGNQSMIVERLASDLGSSVSAGRFINELAARHPVSFAAPVAKEILNSPVQSLSAPKDLGSTAGAVNDGHQKKSADRKRNYSTSEVDRDNPSSTSAEPESKPDQQPEPADTVPARKSEPETAEVSREAQTAEPETYRLSRDGEYRRTPGAQIESLTAAEARTLANGLMKDWEGRPPITVADSISEFPKFLRDAIRAAGAESDMRAVYLDNHVYILAPRIPNEQALQEVILHETIGHYGLRKMLGGELKPLLNRVYMAMGNTDQANALKETYFPDGFDPKNMEHRLTIAEELIAHLAESNQHQKLWNRVKAAIRDGLRRLGFTLELNDTDLLNLLQGAQRTVEQGGFSRPSDADLNFSRAGRSGSDRTTWPADFPKVPFAAELGAAEKHPRYAEAKAGDIGAATELVDDIVSEAAIQRVKDIAGDSNPRLVPAMAEEASGDNAIPAAYAVKLGEALGLEVEADIVQAVRAKRTGTGADYRLANHSVFEGPVIPGQSYLIVDDTMTMGGTLAGLRGHIEANGGNVVGATALTGFGDQGQLALTEKMRQDLWRKHGEPLNEYLQKEFGYGIDSLTQGEAGHFRKAVSLDAIRDRITAAKIADNDQQNDTGESGEGVIPPGFRFSLASVPDLDPQPFGPPSDTLIRRLVSKIADKHTVLKGVQKNIQDQFGEIPEPANAYRAEELFHGKVENDVRLIQENMVEPLAKEMSENNVSLKQLDEYLYALHAPERNAMVAERDQGLPDGGSGMTDSEAAAIIAKVKKEGKLKQYQALAKRVHDILAMRRKILKNSGLLDEDTVGAWEASYKNYVPLKGWAADEQQPDMPRIGKGFAIAGKESQMAAGRTSKAASPVAYAISDLSEAVLRRRKNEVGNTFMNLVQAYPNDNYWRIYTDENPEVERKVVKVKDPDTGKMVWRTQETAIPPSIAKDRYFTTKVDGKTHYIRIEDQRLMNAMRNIGPDNSNLLIRSLAAVTRLMSSLNTSYNPEFVISNFSRDIQTALLNLTSEQSSEDGKARGKKIAAKTLKNVGTSIRAINASLKGKKLTGKAGEWQAHFDQFRADGAKTGWFDMKDIDGQMKDLEKMIAVAGGGPVNTVRRAFKATTDWVENTNSAIENGVRLSAYVNAIEAGISRSQAASLAKNMTVNFNRKGELGTMMNALYMFANASVQGTANFVRTLGRLNGVKGDPTWQRMHTAQKIAVGMAVGGFALSMLNRMVAGEDDDEVNWWDKVPDYIKERNIVIMKSLVGGEPGEYWTIPLPYGYNIFPVIGTQMEHIAFSESQSAGDAASNVALAALGSFSPIGFEQSEELYGILAKNIMPTILRPVASISLNENFMGGPIFKENFPFGTQKPDSALYFRSTPEAFKTLAEGLNDLTGGSEFRSGAMDLSPDVMQFLVGYYGGGAYDFFTSRTPNFLTKLATGVELEDREIPFKRKLTGKVLPYEDQSKFYDRRNEINQLVDERKALKGRERIEFMKDYREKLRLQGVMKSTEDRLKKLREQRDRIEIMDLSAAEEDEKLQRVEKQMKRAIDQFNKRYNEADD